MFQAAFAFPVPRPRGPTATAKRARKKKHSAAIIYIARCRCDVQGTSCSASATLRDSTHYGTKPAEAARQLKGTPRRRATKDEVTPIRQYDRNRLKMARHTRIGYRRNRAGEQPGRTPGLAGI